MIYPSALISFIDLMSEVAFSIFYAHLNTPTQKDENTHIGLPKQVPERYVKDELISNDTVP